MNAISRRGVLGFALAVSAGWLAQAEARDAPTARAAIAALLAARIDLQHRGVGGLISAVNAQGGWTASHGVVARGAARRVSLDTPFQIASLTKIFTALLLSDAVRRREISLDDTLAACLQAPVPSFEGREITLADLATHTSGLPLRPPSRAGQNQDNPYAGYSDENLRADIAAMRLPRAPGAAFEYSNFGFGLLGAALSMTLGKPYAQLLQERILAPLRMGATTLAPSAATRARLLQGYDQDFAPATPWDFGALASAGGLFSTARDLRKFAALWTAAPSTPLQRAAQAMFDMRRPGPDPQTQMGLGWRVTERGGRRIGWSNGSGGGVRAYLAVVPGAEAVIGYVNMQTAMGVDDIGLHVLDPQTPVDVAPIPLRTAISVPAAVLDRYVGAYAFAPDDTLVVVREGDGLVAISGQNRLQLLAETPTRFFLRDDNITLEFQAPGSGPASAVVFTQAGQPYVYRRVQ